MKKPLGAIAHTRSGDKGDTSNIGVIAFKPEHYQIILREVTPQTCETILRRPCKRRGGTVRAAEPRRY